MSAAASSDPTSSDSPSPELPQTFRFNGITYFTVPMALLVTVILAGANPAWLGWTLVVPVLLTIWIARVKTVVTDSGLRSVRAFGSREVSWAEIDGLKFTRWGPTRAVLGDGSSVALPAITFNDMSRLSKASRGRIPDPLTAAGAAS